MLTQSTAFTVAEEAYCFKAVPRSFRFSDVNVVTGELLYRSRFGDLPPWVADVVIGWLGMRPRQWDGLVAEGNVAEVVDLRVSYSLANVIASLSNRVPGKAPAGVCPDCWGTGIDADSDGSMTGTVGTPFLCYCMGG